MFSMERINVFTCKATYLNTFVIIMNVLESNREFQLLFFT